jgi:F-type H+-transporting ATPase subunit gamma
MASTREMRLRIRSVKNISQVTRALETVSASKVRRAIQATNATKPYADKAWKILLHLVRQPGASNLHPLLEERPLLNRTLVVMVSSDRGLAGPYNVNILRKTLEHFHSYGVPVSYVTVGRKGREMLIRRGRDILADFSDLPSPASFLDVSAIGRLLIEEYLEDGFDQIFIAYTDFINMVHHEPVVRKLLPLEIVYAEEEEHEFLKTHASESVFAYEPDQTEILEEIIPRFIAMQVYQGILSSQASEHAARMVAMRNATDNANELIGALQLEYNKIRQQGITNDMLDIVGGVEALGSNRR